MTLDEGYIKYESHWTPGPAPHMTGVRDLERWRRPLYEAQLIGEYTEHGIGYGNISVRRGSGGLFLISGTQTGHLPVTDERHYSLVTDCDSRTNIVRCSGPIQASSEAMTHGSIYALGDAMSLQQPRRIETLIRDFPSPLRPWSINIATSHPPKTKLL